MYRHLSLALFLVACGGSPAITPIATTNTTPVSTPAITPVSPSVNLSATPPASAQLQHVNVVFTNVQTTATCFFFSGPAVERADIRSPFPAEATYDVREDRRVLRFDESTAFMGTSSLVRETSYEYQGKWEITERIEIPPGAMLGRYTYQECMMGGICPGNCSIQAEVELRRIE